MGFILFSPGSTCVQCLSSPQSGPPWDLLRLSSLHFISHRAAGDNLKPQSLPTSLNAPPSQAPLQLQPYFFLFPECPNSLPPQTFAPGFPAEGAGSPSSFPPQLKVQFLRSPSMTSSKVGHFPNTLFVVTLSPIILYFCLRGPYHSEICTHLLPCLLPSTYKCHMRKDFVYCVCGFISGAQ